MSLTEAATLQQGRTAALGRLVEKWSGIEGRLPDRRPSGRQRLHKSGVRRFATDGRMVAALAENVTVGHDQACGGNALSCSDADIL